MISWPSSQTSQPRPQAPSAGDSQLSSTKRTSCLVEVQADGFQAAQVEFLRVARIGLEDDLVLVVHLHAVGVLAIAAIIGAERGLHIGHVPRLRAQHAQHRGRVHGAGADLLAVGLPERAAVGRPIFVKSADDFLHGWDIVHGFLSVMVFTAGFIGFSILGFVLVIETLGDRVIATRSNLSYNTRIGTGTKINIKMTMIA